MRPGLLKEEWSPVTEHLLTIMYGIVKSCLLSKLNSASTGKSTVPLLLYRFFCLDDQVQSPKPLEYHNSDYASLY